MKIDDNSFVVPLSQRGDTARDLLRSVVRLRGMDSSEAARVTERNCAAMTGFSRMVVPNPVESRYIAHPVEFGGKSTMHGAILRLATMMTRIGWVLVLALGAALHLLTIVIAFRSAALWGAVSTAVIPVGAEIYWLGSFWSDTGRILNYYTLSVIVFLAVLLLTILSAALVAIASDSLPDAK